MGIFTTKELAAVFVPFIPVIVIIYLKDYYNSSYGGSWPEIFATLLGCLVALTLLISVNGLIKLNRGLDPKDRIKGYYLEISYNPNACSPSSMSIIEIKYSKHENCYKLLGTCYNLTKGKPIKERKFTSSKLDFNWPILKYDYKVDLGTFWSEGHGTVTFNNNPELIKEGVCFYSDYNPQFPAQKTIWKRLSKSVISVALGKVIIDNDLENLELISFFLTNPNKIENLSSLVA